MTREGRQTAVQRQTVAVQVELPKRVGRIERTLDVALGASGIEATKIETQYLPGTKEGDARFDGTDQTKNQAPSGLAVEGHGTSRFMKYFLPGLLTVTPSVNGRLLLPKDQHPASTGLRGPRRRQGRPRAPHVDPLRGIVVPRGSVWGGSVGRGRRTPTPVERLSSAAPTHW
jgi:hypothetical protein